VVKEKRFPHIERLVPLDYVIESKPHLIRLRCTQQELRQMASFIETEFIPSVIPEYVGESFLMQPYAMPESMVVPIEHEQIPPDELAVHRGAQVKATDGTVGRVDEFLVNPTNGHITHLVLREGHLWGQRDVTIPISQIHRIEEDAVYLKLDKRHVETLPAIPVRRGGA
jgi:sporulation protein YlmC with PRC-barrel domain